MPLPNNFQEELIKIFEEAEKSGLPSVEVNSGELHRKVGGYPGNNHRMPMCCSVMRQFMNNNDSVIQSPPKGNGASLTIRYAIPR